MKQAASFFASDSGSDSPGPKIGSDIEEKVTEEDKGYDSDENHDPNKKSKKAVATFTFGTSKESDDDYDFWVYGKPFLLIYF